MPGMSPNLGNQAFSSLSLGEGMASWMAARPSPHRSEIYLRPMHPAGPCRRYSQKAGDGTLIASTVCEPGSTMKVSFG